MRNSIILFASKDDFFWPTINNDLRMLDNYDTKDALFKSITAVLNNLALQIDVMQREESEYKTGKKKQMITDWWLDLIEQETNTFLVERGWHKVRCIPEFACTPSHSP